MFANKGKKEDGKNKKNADLCSSCYYILSNYTGDHSSYIDTWTVGEDEWLHKLRGYPEPFTLADNFFSPFLRHFGYSHCLCCVQNLSIKIRLWKQVRFGITTSELGQSYAYLGCIILHALHTLIFSVSSLFWRGFCCWMQLHENWWTKRAGVAGIALRSKGVNMYAPEPYRGRYQRYSVRRWEKLRLVIKLLMCLSGLYIFRILLWK